MAAAGFLSPIYVITTSFFLLRLEGLDTSVLSRDYPKHCSIGCSIFLEGRKEMFYLTMHSTHFIYSYMESDIWLRTILIVREETCCHHIGYSFRLTARVLLYASSHIQDNTYTAFVTPVVEHWLEREIAQWV